MTNCNSNYGLPPIEAHDHYQPTTLGKAVIQDEYIEEIEHFFNDPEDNPALRTKADADPYPVEIDLDFHGDFDSMSDEAQDAILNPKHYKIFPEGTYQYGIEYTDLCVALFEKNGLDSYTNHLIGQALKYLTRVGQKDAASQDLGKAAWYLDEAKAYLTKEGRYNEDKFQSTQGGI